MTELRPQPAIRPPVAAGCTFLAAAAALSVAIIVFVLNFLSSPDGGKTVLDDAAAYAPGSVQFISTQNIFIVRLGDTYLALSDLDAANRATPQRRCRVQPLFAGDPALAALLARYQSRVSPAAAGTSFLFRESCNNAIYDVTGVRLDADGPNLDRHPTDVNGAGRLRVNMARRSCSERREDTLAAAVACP
ncbi:MAG: hypothetical protein HYX53_09725 [Chloroflexi bacterium]|nr:hypothetical protein [Chloroflexota bacterium]